MSQYARESYSELVQFGSYLKSHPQIVELFVMKSKMISAVRRYLDERGAVELHMPVLQTYREGAPVYQFATTHPVTAERFYLRHCMEDHLRRAVFSFGEVYEIGKAVRAEDEDGRHAIEFLVLEYVAANMKYLDGIAVVRRLLEIVTTMLDAAPWPRLVDWQSTQARSFNSVLSDIVGFTSSDEAFRPKAQQALQERSVQVAATAADWELLEALTTHCLEPSLIEPTIVVDFPAKLQHICAVNEQTGLAERFSLIASGIEVCDGGVKFGKSADYREVYDENAEYRARVLEIADNESPEELYADIDSDGGSVFTFGFGVDRLLATTFSKNVHEVMLFPCH